MIKKIVSILICMTLFATGLAVAQPEKNNESIETTDANLGSNGPIQPLAIWDTQLSFDVAAASGAAGNAGAEFDGTNFYSTRWASNLIHRYDTSGVKIEEFSIPGVTGLRDLAFDGTYMYGGAAAGTIYKMDFTTKTLVGTITGSFQCRAIAYDTDLNVIYCKNWGDPLYVVNPTTGAIITTYNFVDHISTYGLAYDNWTPGGPFLWIFDQVDGYQAKIFQYDLTAHAFTTVTRDVAADFPAVTSAISGGLFFTADFVSGKTTLGGLIQGTPDTMFCYEIGTVTSNSPPNTPGAPSGPNDGFINIEYQFNASTTDPEGDNISYMFDWGDSHNSGWVGPYASGVPAHASHIWAASGVYQVKVKAKDENNAESNWSSTHTISIIAGPVLKIGNITGGLFKIKATIKNIGEATANNIVWTINLTGGFVLSGKLTSGPILSLAPGSERTITSKPIIGFGKTVITITATVTENSAMKQQNATLLLFFIKIK